MAVIEDTKDNQGNWLQQYKNNSTKAGVTWQSMMKRCLTDGRWQDTCPSYIGCSVSESFSDFQTFTEWYVTQVGYGLPKYELDKDILVKGNKIYCPENCVLVPQELNKFLIAPKNKSTSLPQGVTWHNSNKKFQATIRENGKKRHLGYFTTEADAYTAYKVAKEQAAKKWYNRLLSGEFMVDSRVIERLKFWQLNESEGIAT